MENREQARDRMRIVRREQAKRDLLRKHRKCRVGKVFAVCLDTEGAEERWLSVLGNPTDVRFNKIESREGNEVQYLLEMIKTK